MKFPRVWLAMGWVLVVLALYVCLAPSNTPALHELFVLNDKAEHAVGYVGLTFWFTGIYPRSRYLWIALALFFMGVAVELLQGWMAMGRECDVYDALANTVGIVVGIVTALLLTGGWAQRIESLFVRSEH